MLQLAMWSHCGMQVVHCELNSSKLGILNPGNKTRHLFNSLFSRTTCVSWHQKGYGTRKVKPVWILMQQEMMGWQWHQLDHMQIAPHSRRMTTPETHSIDLIDRNSGVFVHPSIRTSTKFFRFWSNLVCRWTSARYVHQCDLDPIYGQGHGASKVAKIALF